VKSYLPNDYVVVRDESKCIRCKACVNQCTYETHSYDAEDDVIRSKDENCVNCKRCVVMCPTQALSIEKNPNPYRDNASWTYEATVISAMGSGRKAARYIDEYLMKACRYPQIIVTK